MKNIINKDLKIGEVIKVFNGIYQVDNIYQVSNEYMEEHNLYHKNRITLNKLQGSGQKRLDFAITG